MQLRFERWLKASILILTSLLAWRMPAGVHDTTGLPEVEFGQSRYEFSQQPGSAILHLKRRGDTNAAVAVDIIEIGGTATAADYSFTPGPVAIGPGKTDATVTIALKHNAEARGTRAIKFALSNPVAARLGAQTTAEVWILDNDGPKRAWLTFGLNRIPALSQLIGGIPLWQYFATLFYVILAYLVAKFVDVTMRGRVKAWATRSRGHFDDLLVELLRAPVRIIIFVILLHVGLNLFAWPGWFSNFVHKGLTILVALSLTYAAVRVIDLFATYWKQRATEQDGAFSEQLLPIIQNTIKVFALVLALLFTLSNLGVNITSLITSLGIGGLALALAAQDTLANFFGALVILADKPFRIGDRIQLDKVDGTVEAVGFRSTRVRGADGNLIYIPNKTIGNATITNAGRPSKASPT